MSRYSTAIALLLLLTSFSPVSAQTARASDQIVWEQSWKEAVSRAKSEKKPILIHFNMDNEPACAGMASGHFRNAAFVELASHFICVVGSQGEHSGESIFDDNGHQCRRFGTVSCKEHQATEIGARWSVLRTNVVTAPQFIITTPDLTLLARRPFDASPGEIMNLMKRSLYYYNPSLAPADAEMRRKKLIVDMLERAKSDNAVTRKEALGTLATRDDPEVIAFLLKQTTPNNDEIKRREAIRAIGAAGNATCLQTLQNLLRDRSIQIRCSTLIALYKLKMSESVPPMVKSNGVESNTRNHALILRAGAVSDGENTDLRKLIARRLKSGETLLRLHAIRALVDTGMTVKEFDRTVQLAARDSDKGVRAAACHAATNAIVSIRLTMTDDKELDKKSDDSKIIAHTKALVKVLQSIQKKHPDEDLRDHAAHCLLALQDEESDYEILSPFFDEDEIFEESDETSGGKKGRGGRGGGGRGGRGGGGRGGGRGR